MKQSVFGEDRVIRHTAGELLLEPKNDVPHAHPVVPRKAITAFVAWHNLFGNYAVTDGQSVLFGGARSHCDDAASKFMTGNARWFDIAACSV